MAKGKSGPNGVNKSAAIRELLDENPKTTVKDIVATLDQKGLKVHPNLVYLIKSKRKQHKKRVKRQQAVKATEMAGFSNPVALIMEVHKLAEKTGGLRHLKQLVDLLAE